MKRRRQTRRAPPGAHIRAIEAYLARCGATDVAIEQNGAVRVRWSVSGQAMAIAVTASHRNATRTITIACQDIRRRYAAIGITVGAS